MDDTLSARTTTVRRAGALTAVREDPLETTKVGRDEVKASDCIVFIDGITRNESKQDL